MCARAKWHVRLGHVSLENSPCQMAREHVPNAVNLAMLTSRLHFFQVYLFFYLIIYITFQKRISI